MNIQINEDGSTDVLNISKSERLILLKSLKLRYLTIETIIGANEEFLQKMLEIGNKAFDVDGGEKQCSMNEYVNMFADEYALIYDILYKSKATM